MDIAKMSKTSWKFMIYKHADALKFSISLHPFLDQFLDPFSRICDICVPAGSE